MTDLTATTTWFWRRANLNNFILNIIQRYILFFFSQTTGTIFASLSFSICQFAIKRLYIYDMLYLFVEKSCQTIIRVGRDMSNMDNHKTCIDLRSVDLRVISCYVGLITRQLPLKMIGHQLRQITRKHTNAQRQKEKK